MQMSLSLAALLTLLPVSFLRWRRHDARDAVFYGVVLLALAGPVVWVGSQLGGAWRTGFAMSLWVSIAVTMALFLALAALTRHAWRLTPLLAPLVLVLGVIATAAQSAPDRPVGEAVPAGWLDAHIVFALVTYGLLTIAAVAGLAVFLQERALKAKQPNALTRRLPAVAESETLEFGLLVAAEAVLALGLASGMAAEHFLHGSLLPFDHKTVLSIAAFGVIGGLLIARRTNGIRGRRMARLALLAYLLLTLAYPGVKFVTDILMA
ncbi:MAG TPA: cytochrome c biogenesis protein CcsA [Stellaceae bacterium]|nr:cytochrome c biogenesis protein CcsA [Stellaceae bacterium]